MEKNENKIDKISDDIVYLIYKNQKLFVYIALSFLLVGIIGRNPNIKEGNGMIQWLGIFGGVGILLGIVVGGAKAEKGLAGGLVGVGVGALRGLVGGVIAGLGVIIGGDLGRGIDQLGGSIAVSILAGIIFLIIAILGLTQYLDNDQEKDTDTESNDRLMNMLSPIITNTQNQINRLKRNAHIGLIIGIVSNIIAIIVLSYAIFGNQTTQDWGIFVSHFIPRFTFAVFIELFAYFFLRLYIKNLDDINYFQNELTNLRAKTTTIKMLHAMSKEKDVAELIKELFKIERNFKLAKGESTIDIEKAKIGGDWEKKLITLLEEAVKNIQKK